MFIIEVRQGGNLSGYVKTITANKFTVTPSRGKAKCWKTEDGVQNAIERLMHFNFPETYFSYSPRY